MSRRDMGGRGTRPIRGLPRTAAGRNPLSATIFFQNTALAIIKSPMAANNTPPMRFSSTGLI